jgi:hypothetical protein
MMQIDSLIYRLSDLVDQLGSKWRKLTRLVWKIKAATIYRHHVKVSWELNDEYLISSQVKEWRKSAPGDHILWIDQPEYRQWTYTGGPWITTYHYAFKRSEDAMLHALRRPE